MPPPQTSSPLQLPPQTMSAPSRSKPKFFLYILLLLFLYFGRRLPSLPYYGVAAVSLLLFSFNFGKKSSPSAREGGGGGAEGGGKAPTSWVSLRFFFPSLQSIGKLMISYFFSWSQNHRVWVEASGSVSPKRRESRPLSNSSTSAVFLTRYLLPITP